MKILSCNVNGIRAADRKDFSQWFKKSKTDIFCLQEVKAQKEQLSDSLLCPKGYNSYFNFANKKGYSGVAIYSKREPLKVKYKLGLKRFDQEGRMIEVEYPDLILINLYLPHGGRNKENLEYKLESYNYLLKRLRKLKSKKVVLIGDFNIAHHEMDLARPKSNKNNIMFTLEERKQIDRLLDLGFVDAFRRMNQKGGNYTWWPYAFNARERNIGWRIDYAFVSTEITVKKAFILPKINISDHCPIGLEL